MTDRPYLQLLSADLRRAVDANADDVAVLHGIFQGRRGPVVVTLEKGVSCLVHQARVTMPYNKATVETIVDDFASQLANSVHLAGAVLNRVVGDGSDRTFAIEVGNVAIGFVAKLSQSSQGFWGITYRRAGELSEGGKHLILLTSSASGYLVRKERVKFYLGKASQGHDGIKVNESILRRVPYFNSTNSLWTMLQQAQAAGQIGPQG